MKRYIISLALAIVSIATFGAKRIDVEALKQHFVECLNNGVANAAAIKDSKLSAKQESDARKAVWAAWCDACGEYDLDCLPDPDSLKAETPYRWQLPDSLEPNCRMPFYFGTKGNKPSEGYPLFLYMHGSGPREREWQVGLKWCEVFNDAPSLYFIPQIPNAGRYYRWWHRSKQVAWERLLRQAFVSGLVNARRVYFFGISEGAYGSQRMASFYADYLAGAGPIAGGEPLINAPVENLAGVAFMLTSGENDTQFCRNKFTMQACHALDSMATMHRGEYPHRVFLQPGRDHSCDYTFTTPWLKTFTRNPYPKHFKWENFAMHGRFRQGFYNLQIVEPCDTVGGRRACYEFTARGNEIDIEVHNVRYVPLDREPMWDIVMHYEKVVEPATGGRLRVYLNDQLVDLNRPVVIRVNGKKVFKGKVKRQLRHMVGSCALFFDPERIFPAAVDVEL